MSKLGKAGLRRSEHVQHRRLSAAEAAMRATVFWATCGAARAPRMGLREGDIYLLHVLYDTLRITLTLSSRLIYRFQAGVALQDSFLMVSRARDFLPCRSSQEPSHPTRQAAPSSCTPD